MPVIRSSEGTVYEILHGSRFESFVRSETGSSQLCAWLLHVPPSIQGAAHRIDREEVLLVLDGDLLAVVDGGDAARLERHDVLLVPAGSELRVDAGANGATAWVTAAAGLTATMPDGATISPPWAQ